jgi:DNA polymerase-3 subunit gamma/tau
MSYQVLARKWRPRDFSALVGQEHVVRALTYALEHKRLHHAWLFTGTRGVGKTTLARILAKSLNCIGPDGTGDMTAQPCGVCRVCTEIDAGRFVDYIELDAASNRGVDEITQLLEQAVYAPNTARFKVYVIDEVHMLTHHAFNAMLKTLEEPPEHIKFILATTDPQKIPVTVLSRCLQFNLKQMPVAQIVSYLEQVLTAEKIAFDHHALRLIARAAQGSMRDALSLTDQAIAYGAESVTENIVQSMLGALDQRYLVRILDSLAQQDGPALLALADEMLTRSLSLNLALSELASLLHKVAVVQSVPEALLDSWVEVDEIKRLAAVFDRQEVQLFYQIANHGRQDLVLAPDEYAGFTMTLLRMLAFRPRFLNEVMQSAVTSSSVISQVEKTAPLPKQQSSARVSRQENLTQPSSAGINSEKTSLARDNHALLPKPSVMAEHKKNAESVPELTQASAHQLTQSETVALTPQSWPQFAAALPLRGLVRQLAHQSELTQIETVAQGMLTLCLRVPVAQMTDTVLAQRLEKALAERLGQAVKLVLTIGKVSASAASIDAEVREAKQQMVEKKVGADPFVQQLIDEFDMEIVPGSVQARS